MLKKRLTKRDKARVIVTALYNLPELATEECNENIKKEINRRVALKLEFLDCEYLKACTVLLNNKDYILKNGYKYLLR